MNDDDWVLQNFAGSVRMFPLPNVVLFPHVVQPLHIFEPRYRKLTADALAADSLLAMALTRPDWDKEHDGPTPVFDMGCLGRIVAQERFADGRYLLLVRGLSRVRFGTEFGSEPYRQAHVQLVRDEMQLGLEEIRSIRRRLAGQILPRMSGPDEDRRRLEELFEGELPLGSLVDCLAFQLPITIMQKQELLETPEVGTRAERLYRMLQALTSSGSATPREFPPRFSDN